jgi:hypothetical protein
MSCQITEPKLGSVVVFEGDGFAWRVLSTLLGWFYPEYNKFKPKPWHVGFISRYDPVSGWLIAEATGKGVQENPLSDYDAQYYKLYDWLDELPDPRDIRAFLSWRKGCPYDAQAYVWVTLACLAKKLLGINIGRWRNNSYMCWELVEEFAERMDKPFCKDNRTITIVDIIKRLEEK